MLNPRRRLTQNAYFTEVLLCEHVRSIPELMSSKCGRIIQGIQDH
jgi:hypothetical protein